MEIETVVQRLCDAEAAKYSEQAGHGFSSPEEAAAWVEELSSSVSIRDGHKCIDVGAGTGVLTHLIASLVAPSGVVIAQDLSSESLAVNNQTMPTEQVGSVEFLHGDAHDASLFLPRFADSVDFVIARQSVVLFRDPLSVFGIWRQLLKPAGKVVIVDALWSRASWTGEWSELIDNLPLSCLQTLGTIPYLLEHSGLKVVESRFLHKVNRLLGNEGVACPRFLVVAERSEPVG